MTWWRARQAKDSQTQLRPHRPDTGGNKGSQESHAIRNFFGHLSRFPGLQILDLGGLSEKTAWYVSGLGHRITFISLLKIIDQARPDGDPGPETGTGQWGRRAIQTELQFPANSFHAVLAWDVLQHLDEISMQFTISQLAHILRPGGVVFCLFHAGSNGRPVPVCKCSVVSETEISVTEVDRRPTALEFSARELERLFPEFRAVNFYLKRNARLEVLVMG